jgi:protease-4
MGVESIYRRFLGIVAQARGKTPAQVDAIAQGRVWAGGQAHQLGLIDRFGSMDDAIAEAARLAKLGDERGVTYLERPKSFRSSLMGLLRDGDEGETNLAGSGFGAGQEQLLGAVSEAQSVLSGPSVQLRCLECGAASSPQAITRGERSGLLVLLGRLFG